MLRTQPEDLEAFVDPSRDSRNRWAGLREALRQLDADGRPMLPAPSRTRFTASAWGRACVVVRLNGCHNSEVNVRDVSMGIRNVDVRRRQSTAPMKRDRSVEASD